MGDKTGIEWTDATWNPMTGCKKVSEGCRHCYAKYQAWPRLIGAALPAYAGRKFEQVAFHPERLDQPVRWRRPRRIFVNSLSDVFIEDVRVKDLDAVFAMMAFAYWHTFQVLTKRAERMHAYLTDPKTPGRIAAALRELAPTDLGAELVAANLEASVPLALRGAMRLTDAWPLRNVWMGVSTENQESAETRIPWLLRSPAAVRWVSAEPLIGPLNLAGLGVGKGHCPTHDFPGGFCVRGCPDDVGLDWVVVGGESAGRTEARPLHPAWVRELRDQCAHAGVPFLFKQWGSYGLARDDEPETRWAARSGGWADGPARDAVPMHFARKTVHGRHLDGDLHDGYPAPRDVEPMPKLAL